MNPKYAPTLIIGGIILAGSVGVNIVRSNENILLYLPVIIFAILSIGYGLKLRGLNRKEKK